jgi:DNA-directed RNA polymerase specialized sigma24 family protein
VGEHVPHQAAPPSGRPAEVSVDQITEHELAGSAARLTAGLRSTETEVLDALPDNDIKAAMDSLPEGFRTVVYYADVQGYTYAETAAIMNIPIGTVMSRVSRGRQRLRIALAHLASGRDDFAAAAQRIA